MPETPASCLAEGGANAPRPEEGRQPVNYDKALDAAIDRLHDEGRYRTFIDIERKKGQFPHAVWNKPDGTTQDITVW